MPSTEYSNWAKEQAAKTLAARAAAAKTTSVSSNSTPSSSPAPGTQASAQAWINNSASGQGGLDAYTQRQNARYQAAVTNNDTDLINKLVSDSQRVGYGLTNPVKQQGIGNNTSSAQSYIDALNNAKKAQILADLGKSRDASLSNLSAESATIKPQYTAARNQTAANSQQQARNFAEFMAARGGTNSGAGAQAELTRGATLQGNIGSLNQQEVAANQDIARRTSDLQNAYQSDVASANAGIEADKMNALLNDYYQQQQRELQIAQLTGMLGGQQTLAGQGQAFNQGLAQKQANWGAYLDAANLTGSLGNGPQSNWGNLISNANSNNPTYDAQQDTINNNFNQTQADIQNQQWQDEFNQRVEQDGIQNAIAWANNSVSQQNADRLSANANSGNGSSSGNDNGYYEATSSDMNTIYDTLFNQFSQYDDSTKKSVLTNDTGQLRSLVNAILDFELPDDQTTNLLRRFGISQKRAEELLKSSSSSSNSSNSLPSSEQLMRDTLGL